jgi:hypothetical protein
MGQASLDLLATDPAVGHALGLAGAQQAIEHADRKEEGWSDVARGFMAGFILRRPYFTSEEVWIAAEAAGVPKPPDRRAWGGIINGFVRRNLIRKRGTGYSKLPHLHGNHIAVYERV